MTLFPKNTQQHNNITNQKKKLFIPLFLFEKEKKMSSKNRGCILASSIGVVEALKDNKGVCRLSHALRSIQKHENSTMRSLSSQSSSGNGASKKTRESEKRVKQSEDALRTVMYLSCWGPY